MGGRRRGNSLRATGQRGSTATGLVEQRAFRRDDAHFERQRAGGVSRTAQARVIGADNGRDPIQHAFGETRAVDETLCYCG